MVWQQVYDPLSNMWLSTLLAAIPVVVMLVGLGFLHMKAHIAALWPILAGLSTNSLMKAVVAFHAGGVRYAARIVPGLALILSPAGPMPAKLVPVAPVPCGPYSESSIAMPLQRCHMMVWPPLALTSRLDSTVRPSS